MTVTQLILYIFCGACYVGALCFLFIAWRELRATKRYLSNKDRNTK